MARPAVCHLASEHIRGPIEIRSNSFEVIPFGHQRHSQHLVLHHQLADPLLEALGLGSPRSRMRFLLI